MARRYTVDGSFASVKLDGIRDRKALYRGRIVLPDGTTISPLLVSVGLTDITNSGVDRLRSPEAYDNAAREFFIQSNIPAKKDLAGRILIYRNRKPTSKAIETAISDGGVTK